MSTHLFGLTSRTFKHSHAIGRAEFAGTGFRNPSDWQSLPTVLSMFATGLTKTAQTASM